VRDGRASDAPGLARIQVVSWRDAFDGLVPAQVLQELSSDAQVSQFTGSWRDAIASPPTSRHKVLVAYAAGAPGEPVGFASAGPATDEDRWPGTDGQLYEFHLLPEHAGTGHGGRLLHAVADTLSQDGFHAAYTWVLAADSAQLDFLKAAGWAPDGSSANLDMGAAKVPVVRLHTSLAPAGQ
jgi:GNAT superfamily N-acetyltransferase